MRKLILAIFLISQTAWCQTSADLDINNVRATINQKTALFHNDSNGAPGFEVPINSGKHTIYSSKLWLGGKDINGQLHLAAQGFGTDLDFRGSVSPEFQRVWKIDKSTIDYHIQHYNDAGYTMPQIIQNWPAHGDVSQGEDYYMAPFYDADSDGSYTPANGDYPMIKGDQAIWWFMSDDTLHNVTNAIPLGVDIHAMAYAYSCPNTALDNTIFIDYKIINNSTGTYFDTWIGNAIDFDIGDSFDDYIGTMVDKGVFYGYNADSIDGGAFGYGNHPPAQGCMFMGVTQDADGIDNPGPAFSNGYSMDLDSALAQLGTVYKGQGTGYSDGFADNENLGLRRTLSYGSGFTSDPTNPAGYYFNLSGKWIDGSHLKHGGNGYSLYPSAVPAYFMYPGTSDPQYWSTQGDTVPVWSEITESHVLGDRRGLATSGPFTMVPDQEQLVTLAYIFAQDNSTTGNLASVSLLEEMSDSIRKYTLECICPCSQISNGIQDPEKLLDLNVYPNPFNNTLTVTTAILPDRIDVYNSVGQLVLSQQQLKSTKTELDLSHVGPGVYFLSVTFDKSSVTKKIVK